MTMTVRRSRLLPDATPGRISGPDLTLLYERTLSGAGWKTALTISSVGQVPGMRGAGAIRARTPELGMRIEDLGDGSPVRVFNAAGSEIGLSRAENLQRIFGFEVQPPGGPLPDRPEHLSPLALTGGGKDWVNTIIIPREAAPSRRATLQRRNGTATIGINGLEQYGYSSARAFYETLVDPSTAVPMAINVVKDGRLVRRITYSYTSFGPDHILLSGTRFEQMSPDRPTERMIVDAHRKLTISAR